MRGDPAGARVGGGDVKLRRLLIPLAMGVLIGILRALQEAKK